jgi:uncharacterized membrane protein YdbT with pleckstrin-like domain
MRKSSGRSQPRKTADTWCVDPAEALNHQERQAERKREFAFRALCLKAVIVVVAMGMIAYLCWLFLAYNRPEFLEQILPVVAYVAGACGWAHRNSKKK